MVDPDPDSFAEGRNSGLLSHDYRLGPFGSAARAGAWSRELDEQETERQEKLNRDWAAAHKPFSIAAFSGARADNNQGGGAGYGFLGIIVEFGLLIYASGIAKIFPSGEYLVVATIFAILAVIIALFLYVIFVYKFKVTTLFVWTLVGLWFGGVHNPLVYAWIGFMFLDRALLAFIAGSQNLGRIFAYMITAVVSAACLSYVIDGTAAKIFAAGPGILQSYRLARSPIAVTATGTLFDRYNAQTGQRRAEGEYLPKGAVIKIGRIVGTHVFACIGHRPAIIESIFLTPISESQLDDSTPDYRDDSCSIVIPAEYSHDIIVK